MTGVVLSTSRSKLESCLCRGLGAGVVVEPARATPALELSLSRSLSSSRSLQSGSENSGGQMATARNRTKSTQLRAERNLASSRHMYLARVTRKSLRRAFFYRSERHLDTNQWPKMMYDTRAFNTARGVRSLSFDVIRVRIVWVVTMRQFNDKSQDVRTMYLSGVKSATARFYM